MRHGGVPLRENGGFTRQASRAEKEYHHVQIIFLPAPGSSTTHPGATALAAGRWRPAWPVRAPPRPGTDRERAGHRQRRQLRRAAQHGAVGRFDADRAIERGHAHAPAEPAGRQQRQRRRQAVQLVHQRFGAGPGARVFGICSRQRAQAARSASLASPLCSCASQVAACSRMRGAIGAVTRRPGRPAAGNAGRLVSCSA